MGVHLPFPHMWDVGPSQYNWTREDKGMGQLGHLRLWKWKRRLKRWGVQSHTDDRVEQKLEAGLPPPGRETKSP